MTQPVAASKAVPVRQPFVSNADKLGYCPPFDGIRGVAMVMVLLAHLSYANFASFAASVDMFFVISGFLITTLIMEEHHKTGGIDFREFYRRRAFRLFPMLYATIVATVLGALATGKSDLIRDALNDAAAAAFYVYHVVHPVGIEILDGKFPHHRPLVQLWSLSVEEHFYLVAAVMTATVIRYRLPKLLIAAFAAAWTFIAVARFTGHVGPRLAWYQRPDSLLVGVSLAYVHALLPNRLSDGAAQLLRLAGLAATAVLMGVIWVGTGLAPYRFRIQFSPFDGGTLDDRLFWGEFGFSVCNIAIAVMLLAMVRNPDWFLSRWISWRPFREIGIRSYCIYLVHVPLAVILFEQWGVRQDNGEMQPTAPLALIYLVLLVLISEGSHRYIEQPALRWGRNRSARVRNAG